MMKKYIFLVALTLIFWNNLEAQMVNVGIKAGTNHAKIIGTDAYELVSESSVSISGIFSFHAGLFAVVKINNKFAIQPEVLYSEQGFKYPKSYTSNNVLITKNLEVKLDYINFPIMVKYYPFEQFFLDFGPQFGFLLNAEQESLSGNTIVKTDVKHDYEDTDTGFNFGLGYEGDKFTIYSRYTLGLQDLHKTVDADNKNSVIQFGVGYKFM
jgi:hypothetical protein